MMDVLENKNVPGNGNLTDAVAPEEIEPLRKIKAFREEMIDVGPDGDLDRVSKLSTGSTQDPFESWAYKLKITPKKGLLILLILGIISLILFMIVIILAATRPSDYSTETCSTPTCHLFSSKILSSLNESAAPCEDFWEFGCGGWISKNPIPKSRAYWSTHDLEIFQLKEKLRNVINTLPYTDESSSVDMKVKRFYETCMELEYIESEGEKPLKRTIKELGGWQVFRTFRAQDFDFPRILSKLQGVWRTSPFFHVDIVPDPQGPSRNIIKISPSGLTLPHASYYFKHESPLATAYKTYVKDVLQLLGAPSNVASQMAIEIFNFEKRIAEITPEPLELRDPVETFRKVTVGRLRSQSNTIFWADLFKSMFPQANIHDMTEVLVVSEKYLVDISSIISTTDKGNLNNYLMWHFTHKYLPYLSKSFQDVYEIFRKEATGSTQARPRWEFCIDESLRFFPHVINAILANNCQDRENKTAKVETMVENMKKNLFSRFDDGVKYNETMKNFVLDKLRLMSVQVGTPLVNATILNDMYFSLSLQKYEFFQNVQFATDFQLVQMQRNLANPTKDSRILQASTSSFDQVQLSPSLNKIFVPESFLQKDALLLDSSHLPMVYGVIGIPIAEALASAFGIEKGLYSSSGSLMAERDPKAQETRNLIESKRSCLANFLKLIRIDDEPYLERTSLDTLIHLGGIQLAYDTLKNQDSEETYHYLPSLQKFPHHALFFISYVQSECSRSTWAFHELEHATFASLSHDHRVKGVLRQLTAFTEAFSCSTRSEMFADFSCGYAI